MILLTTALFKQTKANERMIMFYESEHISQIEARIRHLEARLKSLDERLTAISGAIQEQTDILSGISFEEDDKPIEAHVNKQNLEY